MFEAALGAIFLKVAGLLDNILAEKAPWQAFRNHIINFSTLKTQPDQVYSITVSWITDFWNSIITK